MKQAAVAGGSKQAAVESKQGSLHGKVRDEVQKWREMQSARLLLLWYSVVRGRQQENSHRQVGSASASPLAFIAVALRCCGTRSHAASSRRNTHWQVGSARASPIAFSPIACQHRRFAILLTYCLWYPH